MSIGTEERIDASIEKLHRVLQLLDAEQGALERRLSAISRASLIAFSVVVASISFLVIILSWQMPQMVAAIATMNQYFGAISDDMYAMRRSMRQMTENVDSMPAMVVNIDGIHGNVGYMATDIDRMASHMAAINGNLGQVTVNVGDMSRSFQIMDDTVLHMTRDVDHMSKPMRMFNQMNPFR